MMIDYYEKVQKIEKNQEVISAVIVDGELAGERALWSNGTYEYKSVENKYWDGLQEKLLQMGKAGYMEVDGIRAFCERINDQNNLIICGAGHVSIPVIKIGKMLGFHVIVIDDRVQFTNQAAAAGADQVICNNFMDGLASVEENINNYFVIVTRGHRYDQDCLIQILPRPSAYIGMIGSKLRVKTVKEAVKEKGFSKDLLDSIYSPIGLKIGAETPEEIGVSIMAEIVEVKNKKSSSNGITKEILERILNKDSMRMAMVTITQRKGSAPRGVGAKMLVMEDGTSLGSIGGGCAESEVFYDALRCIKEDQKKVVFVDMTGNSYEEDGMVCGGVIEVFIEPIQR